MNRLLIFTALLSYCCNVTDATCLKIFPPVRQRTKILGGNFIYISEAPYQASLMIFGIHSCGATIISPTVVVTAAHCVQSTKANETEVRIGSSKDDRGGNIILVDKILKHPNFRVGNNDSDIALVYLSSPIELSEDVSIVSLPREHEVISDGTSAVVTGWGPLNAEDNSNQLKKTVVYTINQETCMSSYSDIDIYLTENMICAGILKKKICCHGDSGGPLVINGYLIGVSSFRHGCDSEYPEVYTRVTKFVRWIGENL